VAHYEEEFKKSGENDAEAWSFVSYYSRNSDVKPYQHPYYWAAFTFNGA
jgi:CHAT domain-containing protein